jgi:glycosyltransferase involved in cell wall biosynthesis
MDKKLNIAHCVESYFPSLGGMPEVVKQLSERMVAQGHSVTVFTSVNAQRDEHLLKGVAVRSFAVSGNVMEGIKGESENYFEALKAGNYDVIVFFAAQQWATDAVIDKLEQIPGKKVFVPTGFSHFFNPEYKSYYEKMRTWMRSFDANVFLAENYTDINFAKENGTTNNVLIPNGAAEEEFEASALPDIREKLGIKKEELFVLHVGTFTGVKGHREALEIFIRSSVKNAVLVLAGNKNEYLRKAFNSHYRFFRLRFLQMLKKKKIIITEKLSREETVAAFSQADLFLFPSNVECSPIVLFEAMAGGTAFLASDAGNSAEIAKWSGGGWILPCKARPNGWVDIDIPASVKLFEKVCADKPTLAAKGNAGKQTWKKSFTWSHIANQYLELYQKLVSR